MNNITCKLSDYDSIVGNRSSVLTVPLFLQYAPKVKEVDAQIIVSELNKSSINTPLRVAHFLAQAGHESTIFTVTKENMNYSEKGLQDIFSKYFTTPQIRAEYARKPERIGNRAYANRNGNGDEASGDGYRYRGRGYLQLTGRRNYTAYSQHKYGNSKIVDDPELVSLAYDAINSSIWYWETNNINVWADNDDILAVSRAINFGDPKSKGMPNGYSDRVSKFNNAKRILKIT